MSADRATPPWLGRNDELNMPRDEHGPIFHAPWEAEAFVRELFPAVATTPTQ